jgi:hypothetical protein
MRGLVGCRPVYRQADIYRASGDFTAAEDAFRQASQWGHEPQPGLAMLRLAEGKTDAAEAAIRRVVAETTDRLRRAKLLPAHIEIMLAVGDVPAARDAATELSELTELTELTEIADDYDTPALRPAAPWPRCTAGGRCDGSSSTEHGLRSGSSKIDGGSGQHVRPSPTPSGSWCYAALSTIGLIRSASDAPLE